MDSIKYEAIDDGGISLHREGSPDLDIYAIAVPDKEYYAKEPEDGLIDMFIYNIIGRSEQVAGRVLLFDARKRLDSLPPEVKAYWEPMLEHRYAVILQTVPDNDWYALSEPDTLDDARADFILWMDRIRPGSPIQVTVGRDQRTLWASDKPGLRSIITMGNDERSAMVHKN